MTTNKPLETQLYFVENFELDGKLDVDNLELNLVSFTTKNRQLADDTVTFNIMGWIGLDDYSDSKTDFLIAAHFTSYINIPNKLLAQNEIKVTSDMLDIKFKNCPDEIKKLIQQKLILKITHK